MSVVETKSFLLPSFNYSQQLKHTQQTILNDTSRPTVTRFQTEKENLEKKFESSQQFQQQFDQIIECNKLKSKRSIIAIDNVTKINQQLRFFLNNSEECKTNPIKSYCHNDIRLKNLPKYIQMTISERNCQKNQSTYNKTYQSNRTNQKISKQNCGLTQSIDKQIQKRNLLLQRIKQLEYQNYMLKNQSCCDQRDLLRQFIELKQQNNKIRKDMIKMLKADQQI